MKRILFFNLVILLSQSAFGQLNTWRWQNPSVQGNTLNAVQMISMNNIVACGDRGTFIHSVDKGGTWDVKNLLLGDSLNLYGLSFLDSTYGMVCGESGSILKTTDGGSSWNRLNTNSLALLDGITVLDKNIAIAVGHGSTILRTTDGGNDWTSIPFEFSGEFTGIKKTRASFITITARFGFVYKSVDSGLNWQRIIIKTDTIVGNDINGQVFHNDNTAIVVGDLGGIFSTTNGGTTWTDRSVEHVSAATLHAIDGKDPSGNFYAAVGEFGTIFNSTDGGSSWSKVNLGITDTLNAISFLDRLNAIAVGKDGIVLRTIDGGASWNFIPSKPLTYQLNGIAFPKGDTSLGVAVGSAGTIMRTTNGGAQWDSFPGVTANNLFAVTFLSHSELCAVGQYGTILRSHDSGLTWELKASGTSKYLKSVNFPSSNSGWAVGDSGIVLSTGDAGSTWAIHPFSKKRYFSGVVFPDSLHGYLCCEHGVYITTDGGATWSVPDDETYYLSCTGISSPSPNNVSFTYTPCDYASNTGIMTSTDGGKSWSNDKIPDSVSAQLTSIDFTDEMHGTAAGYYFPLKQPTGYILHTVDGGNSWLQQDSHTSDKLFGVAFGTRKAGTAVGLKGNIIRITTDE